MEDAVQLFAEPMTFGFFYTQCDALKTDLIFLLQELREDLSEWIVLQRDAAAQTVQKQIFTVNLPSCADILVGNPEAAAFGSLKIKGTDYALCLHVQQNAKENPVLRLEIPKAQILNSAHFMQDFSVLDAFILQAFEGMRPYMQFQGAFCDGGNPKEYLIEAFQAPVPPCAFLYLPLAQEAEIRFGALEADGKTRHLP